ncbi:glycoside hydrolase family 5 protein [Clavulina sp. PMI_390]|nr:glycoside hydrolase family 5 protein [Clavulina sp. PMI_390]
MHVTTPPAVQKSYAHNWHPSLPGNKLSISGRHFLDSRGRVCIPRGVNLGGNSKTPLNHDPDTFLSRYADVTFVGRPFPLSEAPEHFARLRRWGLTLVRFLVTWEALEHAGPGIYDLEYIEYVRSLLSLMSEFGIACFVSMHQDVWSRFSGGSGAPAWTLEAVGFDLEKLEETGAAYLGGVRVPGVEHVKGRWPTGYQKLASATMWTCFFAGDVFTPELQITTRDNQKVGIQSFLQSAFLACFEHLAKQLDQVTSIIGWECLNEPHNGYVNLASLHEFNYYTDLHFHDTPSALQSMALGAGHAVKIPHYIRSWPFPTRISAHVTLNTQEVNVWRQGGPTKGRCLWELHGVWGWDGAQKKPVALRENYFTQHPVTFAPIDWYKDFWYPFVNQWASRLQAVSDPSRLFFVEAIPNELCPESWTAQNRPKNMVYAPHWYDLNCLFTKTFGNFSVNVQGLSRGMFLPRALYWGPEGAKQNYRRQMSNIADTAYSSLERSTPVFVGECGIPMDMNGGTALTTGDFTWHTRAMEALLYALESTMVGFTLWNYNPDNNDAKGDSWNGENFSWFSQARARSSGRDSLGQEDPSLDEGARLLSAVVRPYPAKVVGTPLSFAYDSATGAFKFSWIQVAVPSMDPSLPELATEIFIPSSLSSGRRLIVQGIALDEGDDYKHDPELQTLYLFVRDSPGTIQNLTVSFDPPVATAKGFSLDPKLLVSILAFLLIAIIIPRLSA